MAVESESALYDLALFVVGPFQPMIQVGLDGVIMDLIRGIYRRFILRFVQEMPIRILAAGGIDRGDMFVQIEHTFDLSAGLVQQAGDILRGGLVVELLSKAPGRLERGIDLLWSHEWEGEPYAPDS